MITALYGMAILSNFIHTLSEYPIELPIFNNTGPASNEPNEFHHPFSATEYRSSPTARPLVPDVPELPDVPLVPHPLVPDVTP